MGERWCVDLQSLHRAKNRDCGRYGAVAIQQRRADQSDDEQIRTPCSGLRVAGVKKRQKRDDAAFAAIVCPHDQHGVFERDDEDQCPEDQRDHAEDSFVGENAAVMSCRLRGFLQGIKRAGPDIAIDDTESSDHRGYWKSGAAD